VALLIAPAVWAGIPVLTCVDYTIPYAGPQQRECKDLQSRPFLDPALADYLLHERQGAAFLAATYDLSIAGLGILQTGEPFMALGGYRGSDPILTVEQFSDLVARGEVRFFLSLSEQAEYPLQEGIRGWVQEHCPQAPVQAQGVIVRGPCVYGGR
jgi:4-amino-4-deoxy-L-arabinose transferase-like glycosyltransferase